MKRILLILLPLLLLGCGQDDFADLKQFMDEAGKTGTGKIEPLPPIKPHDNFVYRADQLVDPFSAGAQRPELEQAAKPAMGAAGTVTDYGLETLRVVGTLQKRNVLYAMVATPDNRLHLVKKGDRIGSGKALVAGVDDKGVDVVERVLSGMGKWVEVRTRLPKLEHPAGQ